MAKDETEEGITGLPIPKKKMSPAKRHKFEKERRSARKERGDDGVANNFSQHRMTGSRGHGSDYEVNPRISYRHNEEYLIDYLLGEGFASDEKSAEAIMGAMSEAWIESIVNEGLFGSGARISGDEARNKLNQMKGPNLKGPQSVKGDTTLPTPNPLLPLASKSKPNNSQTA